MAKNVLLTIPHACHEDWQKMTAAEKGRYCMSCRKHVIDFTDMSDREIVNHISRSSGGVCGRLHTHQLNRKMRVRKESRLPWLKYFFQFTLPAFFISMKAEAQDCKKPVIGQAIVRPQKDVTAQLPELIVDEDLWTIRGRIVDESGTPLAGAYVVEKGTSHATVTNANGFYKLLFYDDKDVVLSVSYVGYEVFEMRTKPARNMPATDIKMTMLKAQVLGELIVTGYVRPKPIKRSPLEIARSIITPDSVRIFPNPVVLGNNIDLELKVNKPGNYYVEVTDFSGRLMLKKDLQATAKVFKSSVSTDQFLAGRYIVCVRDLAGKKIGVKKIIVQ
jgi:hypothetical protein